MASARTTYQDRQGGGGEAAAQRFVWVSLSDPSPEELAAVQREFALPAPLVDSLANPAPRPVLELTGELLLAVVKTTTWVADEEAVSSGRYSWCSATASWSASTATGPCWRTSART